MGCWEAYGKQRGLELRRAAGCRIGAQRWRQFKIAPCSGPLQRAAVSRYREGDVRQQESENIATINLKEAEDHGYVVPSRHPFDVLQCHSTYVRSRRPNVTHPSSGPQ